MHMAKTNRSRWFGFSVALSAIFSISGCSNDDHTPRPDSGYGKDQPAPKEMTCDELCVRLGDCGEQLCIEDTSNPQKYAGLGDMLASQCRASCTDAQLASGLSVEQWTCLFQKSCREVFDRDYDVCAANAYYYCR
jgi:hypothetical protein